MFELFIARRYLRAKRKQVVISVITVISVIGVAAGVMALVIAVAITSGFSSTLQKNLLGATGHVLIQEKEPVNGIEGWEQIATRLAKLPHVVSAMPGLYDAGELTGAVRSTGAMIKGVSVQPNTPLPDALAHLSRIGGRPADSDGLPQFILGSRLADSIGAVVNKQLTLIVPNGRLTPFGVEPVSNESSGSRILKP